MRLSTGGFKGLCARVRPCHSKDVMAGADESSQLDGSADAMETVNPELRPALQQVSQFLSRLTYNDASLPELRHLMEATWAPSLG